MELKIIRARILGGSQHVEANAVCFFIRFYVRKQQKGGFVEAGNTKAVVGSSEICWNESFWIELGGCPSPKRNGDGHTENQRIVFELLKKRRTGKTMNPLKRLFRSTSYETTTTIGTAEISVSDLFCSRDGCHALKSPSAQQQTATLELLVSAPPKGMSIEESTEELQLERRINKLDRDDCGCAGNFCRPVYAKAALF